MGRSQSCRVLRSDALLSLTGSRARADVLAAIVTQRPKSWGPRELGRAAGQPHQTVSLELRRLHAAGLLRLTLVEGRRQYELETEDPIARELARFVHQTRGRIPDIRRILESARSRNLAWISACGPDHLLRGPAGAEKEHSRALVVITTTPKRLVGAQLGPIAAGHFSMHPMSLSEWMARLQKGETFVRRARRAPKLWVIGSGAELVRWEQRSITARRTLALALRNAREELSDAWDEDWDPSGSGLVAL